MGALTLPAGSLLLTGRTLQTVGYAVDVAQKARRRNGLPPSRELAALAELLAVNGQTDSPEQPPGEHDAMTIHEAAALLQQSTRTVRRLAPQLGGRKVGRSWLLDRQAVTEHRDGRA